MYVSNFQKCVLLVQDLKTDTTNLSILVEIIVNPHFSIPSYVKQTHDG